MASLLTQVHLHKQRDTQTGAAVLDLSFTHRVEIETWFSLCELHPAFLNNALPPFNSILSHSLLQVLQLSAFYDGSRAYQTLTMMLNVTDTHDSSKASALSDPESDITMTGKAENTFPGEAALALPSHVEMHAPWSAAYDMIEHYKAATIRQVQHPVRSFEDKAKPYRFYESTIVQVKLSSEGNAVCNMYQVLLCRSSYAFFEAFTRSQATEDSYCKYEEGALHVTCTTQSVWELYMNWLLHGEITAYLEVYDPEVDMDILIDLYIFADRFKIPQLKRDTIDEIENWIFEDEEFAFSSAQINKVYNELPKSTKLRHLVVDSFLISCHSKELRVTYDIEENLPTSYTLLVLRSSLAQAYDKKPVPSFQLTSCHEHPTHEQWAECKSCQRKATEAANVKASTGRPKMIVA